MPSPLMAVFLSGLDKQLSLYMLTISKAIYRTIALKWTCSEREWKMQKTMVLLP